MSKRYILGIDQSTAGTKALLFDLNGDLVARCDKAHKQKISKNGWISHDPTTIYNNVLSAVKDVIRYAEVEKSEIICVGISNQRETGLIWDRNTALPIQDAVVWQCSRGASICEGIGKYANKIQKKTGLPLSPFFTAAKISWLLQNSGDFLEQNICAGTIDSWLVYKLTGNFKTDWSNASRTQLLNINTLKWDEEICDLFGIDISLLAEICDSNSCFGETDFDGLLPKAIPVHSVLGDSHAALFGHGCFEKGMMKTTYGTGSSVMLNMGDKAVFSNSGAVTSLAWGMGGKISYVMEGNINYSGAVIKWLVDDIGLINSSKEAGKLAKQANLEDETYIVPAFSGLGAPYWNSKAKALIYGMTRNTGKAEIAKAAENCIAYQIADVMSIIKQDSGIEVEKLYVDGGPTKDDYLMQFQSDILNMPVLVPSNEELSGIGCAYAAGLAMGVYDQKIFSKGHKKTYSPQMSQTVRKKRIAGWNEALDLVLNR